MATRFYLPSSGSAAVSPAYDAAWLITDDALRRAMVTTRISSSFADNTVVTDDSSTYTLARQYVSAPIAAQTITGTVKCQIRCRSAVGSIDGTILGIRVVSNDGSTVRGTLLSVGAYGTVGNWGTGTATNRKFADGDSVTSVVASVSDRIVVEVGVTSVDFDTGTFRLGDNSVSDLPEDTSSTSDFNPWIEFSADLFLATLTPSAVDGVGSVVTPSILMGESAKAVNGTGACPTPVVTVGAVVLTPVAVDGAGGVGSTGWDHVAFPAVEGVGAVEQSDDFQVVMGDYNPADDTVLLTDTTGIPGNKIYPGTPSTLYDGVLNSMEGVGTFSGPGSGVTTIYGTNIQGVSNGSGSISYVIIYANVTTDDTVIGSYQPHTVPQFYLKQTGESPGTYGLSEGIVPVHAGESSFWVSGHITDLTWDDLAALERMGVTANWTLTGGQSSSLFLQEVWAEVYGPQGTNIPPIVFRARTGDILFHAELEI